MNRLERIKGCLLGGAVGDDDDVAAEVENWQIQQTFVDEIQGVEHAPGSAIAIGERVDGLVQTCGNNVSLHFGFGDMFRSRVADGDMCESPWELIWGLAVV
mgnify:CR=1 FL=1